MLGDGDVGVGVGDDDGGVGEGEVAGGEVAGLDVAGLDGEVPAPRALLLAGTNRAAELIGAATIPASNSAASMLAFRRRSRAVARYPAGRRLNAGPTAARRPLSQQLGRPGHETGRS